MSEIKCPSCGSSNVEQINVDKYQCPYCGRVFNRNENEHVDGIITIHRNSQLSDLLRFDKIKIKINNQVVGEIGKGEVLQIRVTTPCQLVFEYYNMNLYDTKSTTIDIDPAVDSDIYLSYKNHFLIASTPTGKSSDTSDVPSLALTIISFVIPIVGLIIFFVKKSECPNSAKTYLYYAICGFGIGLILSLM